MITHKKGKVHRFPIKPKISREVH